MSDQPRILIVTAAFGEGHNSAARSLAQALNANGAVTRVSDPCLLGMPRLTDWLARGYRFATTYLPRVWEWIYRSTDRCDFSRQRGPVMRVIERSLAAEIADFRPDRVVSTYPLYPYFLARIFADSGKWLPVITVVTDSIEINAAWLRAPSDCWLVTDALTREAMAAKGLDAARIVATGFPVAPVFSTQSPMPVDDPCDPFRLLYFPTASARQLARHGRALLEATPCVRLTVVMGRNVRKLYREAKRLRRDYPGRVRLLGWTRRVPRMLSEHHLVVGKAGGATVHEAIAACCPMLIHFLVPGQEEGNLQLLQTIGAGNLATTPEALARELLGLLANDAAGWRAMKSALIHHGCHAGAIEAARVICQGFDAMPSDRAPHEF